MRKSMEETFGSMVFNDAVMQNRLPKNVYHALKRTMELGKGLDPSIADIVAAASPSPPRTADSPPNAPSPSRTSPLW